MAKKLLKIEDIETQLYLSDNALEIIVQKMLYEMGRGLSKEKNPEATVKMLPSFVAKLPDGSAPCQPVKTGVGDHLKKKRKNGFVKEEEGSFLALDLGGTNFRVLLVTISKDADDGYSNIEMDSQIYRVPENVMVSSGTVLFDHIAECMADFLEVCDMKETQLSVGFTFSFPCVQHALNSASLIAWTKGFQCEGVEGENVVKFLEEAIERRGDLKCKLVAIVNDTVGTLMSCAFNEPHCKIGLIVGTGSNTCYLEKKSNIELIGENDGEMIVNMEWGAFGDDGALDEFRNEYDSIIDEASLNLGKQKFEKMISGMYLGEIVRLCLCKLVDQNVIFHGLRPEVLFQPGSFQSSFVSQIESAIEDGMVAVQNILASLDIDRARGSDCAVVTRVCQAVSTRAAHLCAAGIAAVARKIKANYEDDDETTLTIVCGVDGTLYKKHPTFSKRMNTKVQQLTMDHNIDVQFQLSYDGSGKGAALVAAIAS